MNTRQIKSSSSEPIEQAKEKLKPRQPGAWKGKIFVPDDFDEEDEEINKLFYGDGKI